MLELKSYYEACRYMLTARALFDQGEFKSALKVKRNFVEISYSRKLIKVLNWMVKIQSLIH